MGKVWLLALGAFALGLDAYVMAGLLPVVAGDLRASVSLVGQMVTVFTLAYAVAAPLVAGLMAGVRPRVVIVVALGVFTVGNAVTALAPSLGALLAARVVAGAGAGVYAALSTAAASALVPGERRGRALALVMGGMSTGTVLGVPVGVLLAGHAGWRSTMWLVTGLGAVALVGLAALLPPVPADPPVPARARLAAVADQEVAPIVGVSFLAAVASLGLYTYLAPVLASAGGVTEVGPYLWAWGIGGVVGSLVAGPLVDRTGKAAALVGGVLVTVAVAQVLLPLLASAALPGAAAALVLWGAAGWALQVPQQHRLLALRDDRGSVALALNNSALYLGSAVGSALGGLALAAGAEGYALPWAAGGVAALGLVLHLWAGRRSRHAARVGTLGGYEHS
ncbi:MULTISPECIES: MFS transporter [Streptomyces]|uniref:MFS transporter n=3 Tax=Streptomyces rimosus TaxID=1927 RepID=L8EJF8_STRR1|nr:MULTISPECIES: MFS transporter [Streptomyces]KOG68398.1 MFS transporter [Kitasatospora aureofaciens]MYT40978.1 MFS transporter [Streptomyces sp. SID5471]KEF03853.1 MFS transporter [Streptomyces rimosus]KEF17380.1 MFS transporter [Streptomyces rimosus]KOT27663.1 MFS transporter [Streptomyces sp. NRRL WC-3701]